ncbi:MAG: hypothetical protein ACTSX8_08535 [Alphaproteobacteria bacterium]
MAKLIFDRMLKHFECDHLPGTDYRLAKPFQELANSLAAELDGPELMAGLRKLLESRDCVLRAASER